MWCEFMSYDGCICGGVLSVVGLFMVCACVVDARVVRA
jgi:hypothetical protein